MDLRGTVGILTGASRGIGVYLAQELARKGVDLALAARSAEDLEATAKLMSDLGARSITVPTDVTRRSDLEELVARASDELGPVDLLVNNAGIEHYAYFEEADLDVIENVLKTNVIAAEWLTRLVLPDMVRRRKGHIANIASVAGKTAAPYNTVYSSSKHALVGFSWSLREEMKRYGVGVSAICPGYVADAGMFYDWSQGEKPPGLTRTVTPEKVATRTVEAIEKDLAEVIVAPGVLKIVDVLHAISPRLTTIIARRSGGYAFLERGVKEWRGR
ncbi:MAG: SDR family NAD(P)-dependent oxidoreductase [Actinomycetota bacterium]